MSFDMFSLTTLYLTLALAFYLAQSVWQALESRQARDSGNMCGELEARTQVGEHLQKHRHTTHNLNIK